MSEKPLKYRTSCGFTLVELMIVLAIIGILATIALPSMLSSRVAANEANAVGTIRLVRQAQIQFITSGLADVDNNGAGEHGTFGELSGSVAVRATNGGMYLLKPTLVSPAFSSISPLGEIVRHGYYFRIYLPGAMGQGILEVAGGGADASVDARHAESNWCLYAWPVSVGTTGRRVYFTNHSGGISYTESAAYFGAGAPISPGAALQPGGPVNSIVGKPAINQAGRDGNTWRTLSN